jgi:hypothetical protein
MKTAPGNAQLSSGEPVASSDLSSDTQVKWIEDAFYVRPHWWSLRKRVEGTWFSTHVRFPGANGYGDTIEESLDDLAECIREWARIGVKA